MAEYNPFGCGFLGRLQTIQRITDEQKKIKQEPNKQTKERIE